MSSYLPSFSVTVMIREDVDVLQRFIKFYRDAGAEHIYVYIDGSSDEARKLDLTGVTLTECNNTFWLETLGRAPSSLEESTSQTHILSERRHQSDWLLVVDSDELLVGGTIREMLSNVPSSVTALRVRNVEAVWGPNDDIKQPYGGRYFRKPLNSKISWLITPLLYGRLAFFYKKGLLGHSSGKHFLRQGTEFTHIGSHTSLNGNEKLGHWAHNVTPGSKDMVVAHYDAISFSRWHEKWRRRITGETHAKNMSIHRRLQMLRIKKALTANDVDAAKLFRQFYGLNRWQKMVLTALGNLETHIVWDRSK